MKHALTPRQWLASVRAAITDLGPEKVGLYRIDEDTSERTYYEDLEQADRDMASKVTGRYVVADHEGKTLASCILGASGERLSRRADPHLVRERSAAKERDMLSSAWEQQSASQLAWNQDLQRKLDKKDEKIDALRAELDALKEKYLEALASEGEDDSTSELLELGKQALEVFGPALLPNGAGALKKKIAEKIAALLPRLSEGARDEVIPLLQEAFGDELATLQS